MSWLWWEWGMKPMTRRTTAKPSPCSSALVPWRCGQRTIDGYIAGVYVQQAKTLASQGNIDGAAAAYRSAISQVAGQPATHDIYLALVALFADQKRWQDVRETYIEALAQWPQDEKIQIGLAQVNERLGDDQAALTLYQQVLAQDPDNTDAHELLAALYARLGLTAQTLDQYGDLARLKDDPALYHLQAGEMYLNNGRYS